MQALSLDLRTRIVTAYEADEGSYEVIGERFSVSPSVVGKLVRQKRDLNTLAPQVHLRGRKPAVSGKLETKLRAHLKKHPDATVLERRDALGLKCSEKTLWQTLRKMGWRYKKNPRVPQSRTAAMSS
ncbi:COG3415 family protein [Adhaeretor mobilis]|uniref:Transposase n=1 Tax=Adhaeretor mobilis TaxID=1930276 RepID=A0A517MVY4_9BACT|nr:hypothetical protein [Adhaeretor mobilis]QDS99045.1 Transposase [Adhaeretor mobilis]